ncbi:endonuclease/exonuclease/phosphatase family protein [Thalassolituus oleivorans]|uniref:endonuclease/exonuclease/phosphatase family protein n=1 Tax=Thalassolituus oleivorans TaxID=187493 RepID=UPI00042DCF85|nr:endonuclease/exonuclease/phosphatase family protein [Thalassolituus oleivorans]AHK14633.1 endonuclease [Thalassolituus oleivorans R6-15]
MAERVTLREFVAAPKAAGSLRLLTFNMQVGIQTRAYHHYLLRSWQHLLPFKARHLALDAIADLVSHFDIVALQEADGGSWRSAKENQVEYIAQQANFPHWYHQVNRNLGQLAQHANGLLSRMAAKHVEKHTLPGVLPGRGVMVFRFGSGDHELVIAVTHLALDRRTQQNQIAYLVDAVSDAKHLVIMGDLNQEAEWLLQHSALQTLSLHPIAPHLSTYPSWRPNRAIDHILISNNLELGRIAVIDHPLSDHLPVAAEITFPI